MKKVVLMCLTTGVAMAAVAGCARSKSADPIGDIRESAKDRDLQGRDFNSECQLKPMDAILTGILTRGFSPLQSAQTTYRFDGAVATRTTRLFGTKDCKTAPTITFQEIGEVYLQPGVKSTDLGKYIDIDYRSLRLKVLTADGVVAANSLHLCGASNWSVDRERVVTASASDPICYGAAIPRHNSNLYRVDGKILTFGLASKANNKAGDRPRTLNSIDQYLAQ